MAAHCENIRAEVECCPLGVPMRWGITEQERVDEAPRKSTERLRQLMGLFDDCVWELDAKPAAHGGLSRRFRQASQVISFLVTTLGIVVLSGWAFDLPTLTSIRPAFQSMKANTALCFLLLGAGLWLAHTHERIRRVLGFLVVVIAAATLAEYVFNVNLRIDQLLLRDTRIPSLPPYPGRMAVASAICFVFLGLAVTFLGVKKVNVLLRALVAACFALSVVEMCGYLYGVASLYSIPSFSAVAVHTAAGFLAASLAYFLASPDEGLVAIAASDCNSGLLVRTLLPAIIGVPILIGWLRLLGQRHNLYDTPFGVALQVLGSIGCLTALTFLIARSMKRLECEHSRAEQKIRDSEERMRLAHQVARMGAFDWNIQTGVNSWNPELEVLYGLKPGSFGRTLSAFEDLVHPDDRARVRHLVDQCLKDGRAQDGEWRTVWPDGSVHWLAGRSQLFTDGSDRPLRLIGMVSDITERKLADEALATVGRQLIEAHEEERTRIARELHDDITQRLALLAIELAQWSEDERSGSEVREHVRHAQERIDEIAKDVQGLSHRLHSSKLEYLGLVSAARSFCEELAERSKVEIEFRHSGVTQSVPKDVSLCLFRVLQESLQNAVKYSGVRHFTAVLTGTPETIELTVQDAGIGFEEEKASGRKGLGLISMRERINLVHGDFSLKSKPGIGTTIYARVPFKSEELRAESG